MEREERITPMTWDEHGRLVPLDEERKRRLLEIAREAAQTNPELADHRLLSKQESLRLIWLDVAHLIDEFFRFKQESLPLVASASPPVILWIILAYITLAAWQFMVPLAAMVAGFRLWVWFRIERG